MGIFIAFELGFSCSNNDRKKLVSCFVNANSKPLNIPAANDDFKMILKLRLDWLQKANVKCPYCPQAMAPLGK